MNYKHAERRHVFLQSCLIALSGLFLYIVDIVYSISLYIIVLSLEAGLCLLLECAMNAAETFHKAKLKLLKCVGSFLVLFSRREIEKCVKCIVSHMAAHTATIHSN